MLCHVSYRILCSLNIVLHCKIAGNTFLFYYFLEEQNKKNENTVFYGYINFCIVFNFLSKAFRRKECLLYSGKTGWEKRLYCRYVLQIFKRFTMCCHKTKLELAYFFVISSTFLSDWNSTR